MDARLHAAVLDAAPRPVVADSTSIGPSVFWQGVERLGLPPATLRRVMRWAAELPPDVLEELLVAMRRAPGAKS